MSGAACDPSCPASISSRCLQEENAAQERRKNGMKSEENGENSHFRAERLSIKEKFWAKVEKLFRSKKKKKKNHSLRKFYFTQETVVFEEALDYVGRPTRNCCTLFIYKQ